MAADVAKPRILTITRTLPAPRDLVWEAATEPKHLVRWMSAKTWITPSADVDVRPGGEFAIKMAPEDGSQEGFVFGGTYTEVKKPERFVMRTGDGRSMTFEFADEGGATRLTLTIEMAMGEEQERAGWGQIVDKLETLVAGLRR